MSRGSHHRISNSRCPAPSHQPCVSLCWRFLSCLNIHHPTPFPEWFVQKGGKGRDKELQLLKQAATLERPRAQPCPPARWGQWENLLPRPGDTAAAPSAFQSEFSRNLEGGQQIYNQRIYNQRQNFSHLQLAHLHFKIKRQPLGLRVISFSRVLRKHLGKDSPRAAGAEMGVGRAVRTLFFRGLLPPNAGLF